MADVDGELLDRFDPITREAAASLRLGGRGCRIAGRDRDRNGLGAECLVLPSGRVKEDVLQRRDGKLARSAGDEQALVDSAANHLAIVYLGVDRCLALKAPPAGDLGPGGVRCGIEVALPAERDTPGQRLVHHPLSWFDTGGQGELAYRSIKARGGIGRQRLDVQRHRLGLQRPARLENATRDGQPGRVDGDRADN